jgi:hypothetical protein
MWRLFVKIDEVLQETYTETAAIQRAHGKEINKMLALLFVTDIAKRPCWAVRQLDGSMK